MGRRTTGVALALIAALLSIAGTPSRAEAQAAGAGGDPGGGSRPFFRCDRRPESGAGFWRSDAAIDVYHGLIWLGGGAALSLGTDPSRRWTHENGFDSGIQNGLRIDSMDARRDADSSSDFFLALSIGILPTAAIGVDFARDHDCGEALEMFGEAFEATSLALFVSEAIKVASGRERPFGDRCAQGPPGDANCGDADRNLSFVSGHATLAAAGAGVSCRFALERRAFGSSPFARIAPCALGAASAFVSGTLRVASDRHWGTDVLVGFGVGALIGAFDPWGPLEWLRYERRDASGDVTARGMWLPYAREGAVGAQWTLVY